MSASFLRIQQLNVGQFRRFFAKSIRLLTEFEDISAINIDA